MQKKTPFSRLEDVRLKSEKYLATAKKMCFFVTQPRKPLIVEFSLPTKSAKFHVIETIGE